MLFDLLPPVQNPFSYASEMIGHIYSHICVCIWSCIPADFW